MSQTRMFAPSPSPEWCASVLKHRRRRSARKVTIGKHTFFLCAECARPYEGMHGTKVEEIES